jgi:membrane-associated phospholipid phosphatase
VRNNTANPIIHRILDALNSTDRLLIIFWGLLAAITLIFYSRVPHWYLIVAANATAAAAVCLLAYIARSTESRTTRWIHDWAAFPLVLFTFKQLYFLIGPIHKGNDYDHLLIALDRAIFHVDPTEWLFRFSHPVVTEILQVAYSLFYLFFIVVGMELYRKTNRALFENFRFLVVYGFFVSYIGYFFLPAVGPRFTLHDFSLIDRELPGLLVTPALRWFVNIFESIPPGVSSDVAWMLAQRDVFPSGHTMMTLIVIMFIFRYRLRVRFLILCAGTLLIAATVYLRYHYVVDLLAGALLAIICIYTADTVRKRLRGASCDRRIGLRKSNL